MKEGWNFTPDKRDRWNEPVERLRKKNIPLKEALVAAGVILGATNAGIIEPQKQTHSIEKSDREKPSRASQWFRQKMEGGKSIDDERKMESMVLSGEVALGDQIHFVEWSLGPGGDMYTDLHNPALSEKRYSDIIAILNNVSVRLTRHYREKPRDAEFKKYFDIQRIRSASIALPLELRPEKVTGAAKYVSCNGFATFTHGDVYFVTADHCIRDTTVEDLYVSSKQSDQAVRYVPPSEYESLGIKDPRALPELTSAASAEPLSGSVAVSVSYRPDQENNYKEHIEYSFVIPAPPRTVELLYGKNVVETHPVMKNAFLLLRSPEEGKVTMHARGDKYGKPGKVLAVEASGSSGSIAAIPSRDNSIGTLSNVRTLDDNCRNICYAVTALGNPGDLRKLITKDQKSRALAGLGEGPSKH